MKLKGIYSADASYSVEDVVKHTDGEVYKLHHPATSGTPPTDTRYWGKVGQPTADIVRFVLDALDIESVNNSEISGSIPSNVSENAIVLNSSTEDSDKQFIITVDDDGELTATEITEEGET